MSNATTKKSVFNYTYYVFLGSGSCLVFNPKNGFCWFSGPGYFTFFLKLILISLFLFLVYYTIFYSTVYVQVSHVTSKAFIQNNKI